MNPTDFQVRNLAPVMAGAVGVRPSAGGSRGVGGNALMGLDVWGDTSAAQRSLSAGSGFSGNLEETVNHILAPLG